MSNLSGNFGEKERKKLEKMGYRFVGKNKHSAIKICEWCRESLRGRNFCYKQKFYGIQSHRCIQMSPVVQFCNENCLFCWRTIDYAVPRKIEKFDKPEEILDSCIEAQREILQGFKGNPKVAKKKFKEAMEPNQVAVSLAGEPTLYPYLSGLIDEINSRGMTSFLVTNGTRPDIVEKLIGHQPYQLYVTLAAPSESVFQSVCRPKPNAWQNLMKTLSLLDNFDRTVIRLTLVKNLNMVNPEQYEVRSSLRQRRSCPWAGQETGWG
jgi:tRNA wybutosine-synthesizing protein 1